MHDLTSTVGIVAIAAGAVAVVALLTSVVLAFRLSRLRSEQRAVLGDRREDLVAHAASLRSQFEALHQYVEDISGRLDQRMTTAEQRLDGAVAYTSLVRYDAYGEMSGHQSMSIALLDSTRSGVVLSAILHRDQARLYAKQVHGGRGELELSPEEEEAIKLALQAKGGQGRRAAAVGRDRLHRRALIGPMRAGYFGPEGTHTQEALLADIAGLEIDTVPLATIYDTVMAVHEGTVDTALVPIENSLEGSVNATLDALAMETDDVMIVGEVVQPIRHCLIARTSLELAEIKTVVSHPQANAQCARFIRTRLPQAQVLAGSSTADAVRVVAEHDGPWAALGNRLAAERYGCVVLRAGVEDVAENETRFVWLARAGTDPGGPRVLASGAAPLGPWKTAIVFWGLGSEAPGWLVACLSEFARRGVNLTRIESRPRKQGLGRYMFFVDLEGHEEDSAIAAGLDGLRERVERLKVLGCYPAA